MYLQIFWTIYLYDLTQIVSIQMGNACAPLVADLLCNERDFLLSLSDHNQDVVEAFNSASIFLDDLLKIDNK